MFLTGIRYRFDHLPSEGSLTERTTVGSQLQPIRIAGTIENHSGYSFHSCPIIKNIASWEAKYIRLKRSIDTNNFDLKEYTFFWVASGKVDEMIPDGD